VAQAENTNAVVPRLNRQARLTVGFAERLRNKGDRTSRSEKPDQRYCAQAALEILTLSQATAALKRDNDVNRALTGRPFAINHIPLTGSRAFSALWSGRLEPQRGVSLRRLAQPGLIGIRLARCKHCALHRFAVKTTLNIDDTIMPELKREAARQGRTMSELVESALRLLQRSHRKREKLVALPTFHSGGTLVDIADRNALYQAMEGH
jgi:hypothetical protein